MGCGCALAVALGFLVGKERDARTFFLKVDAILEKLGQKPAKNGNSLVPIYRDWRGTTPHLPSKTISVFRRLLFTCLRHRYLCAYKAPWIGSYQTYNAKLHAGMEQCKLTMPICTLRRSNTLRIILLTKESEQCNKNHSKYFCGRAMH